MSAEQVNPSLRDPFVGTWKLITFAFHRSDGTAANVLGSEASGLLIYDAQGHMAGQLMRADRPLFAVNDQQKGTDAEVHAALEGYIAYFGDYVIDEAEKTVIHRTKGAMFPNLVGQDQKRFYEFAGNRLTLTTPPVTVGGITVTGVLVWEKYP